MKFQPDKLVSLRNKLGINKAEAARRLNMSAMGYGRYEKGEREPSFQTVCYIAQVFGTTTDYLYGITEDSQAKTIIISSENEPELFELVNRCRSNDETAKRLLVYYQEMIGSSI